MTISLPKECKIGTASPILKKDSIRVWLLYFWVVPTLVSLENWFSVSSLAGIEVEPSAWYSSRDTLSGTDPTLWCLTSQPSQPCSNHHCSGSVGIYLHNFIPWTIIVYGLTHQNVRTHTRSIMHSLLFIMCGLVTMDRFCVWERFTSLTRGDLKGSYGICNWLVVDHLVL